MSKKPDFCPYIYRDERSIYLEFDGMTLAFDFTEGGLGKALKHVPNVALQPGFVASSPVVNRVLPKAIKVKTAKRKAQDVPETMRDFLNDLIDEGSFPNRRKRKSP